jgi:hypothetical protein
VQRYPQGKDRKPCEMADGGDWEMSIQALDPVAIRKIGLEALAKAGPRRNGPFSSAV